jgi:hypothetical protein
MPALSHLHLHGISFLPLEKADVHRVAWTTGNSLL